MSSSKGNIAPGYVNKHIVNVSCLSHIVAFRSVHSFLSRHDKLQPLVHAIFNIHSAAALQLPRAINFTTFSLA